MVNQVAYCCQPGCLLISFRAMAEEGDFRAVRERMLLRLLLRAGRAMNDEVIARLRASGHGALQPSYTRVLAFIDTEGSRVGELAQWMGFTRQAASKLLDEVERHGYVERFEDPHDARATVARHTRKGRALLDDAVEVMTTVEAEYGAIVGRAQLAQLKATLGTLLAQIDARGTLSDNIYRPPERPRRKGARHGAGDRVANRPRGR
jgi:DNA-binding MarR family transcriptional regulator